MHKLVAFTVAVLVGHSLASAHMDVIINIRPDGVLEGLPAKYGKAILTVEFAPKGSFNGSIMSVKLQLGDKTVILPRQVVQVMQTQDMKEIKASASWYHDPKLLPPYLNIQFYDPGYDSEKSLNPGFSMLFNLETCRLIEFEINVIRNGGNACQYIPINLGKWCKPEILDTFLDKGRQK